RWGGEEFMIIYRSTNLDGAYHHTEILRKLIENTRFEKGINLSASFGVTQPSKDMTLSQLMRCVDNALYSAKNEGRNSIVTHLCDK
ncbi:MAG: GGDEF domain-containing protein, partial [Gammaproteobacteria bacterium]